MRTRGKRVACLAGAVAISTLIAAGIAIEKRIREKWWLYKLSSEELESQRTAAEKLGKLGSLEAVPKLLRIANDRTWAEWPVHALCRIAEHGNPEGLPLWTDALESKNDFVRMTAANVIARFGERAENAIPALIRAMNDERTFFRPNENLVWMEAAEALRRIGPKGETALTAALNDLPPVARRMAERLLQMQEDLRRLPPTGP